MELNWNEMEPELQVLRAATPAQRKIRPTPTLPIMGGNSKEYRGCSALLFLWENCPSVRGTSRLRRRG